MTSRRFKANFDRSVTDLCSTLARMRAAARIDFAGNVWKYEADILRRSGVEFKVGMGGLGAEGVRITFWRDGKGYGYEATAFDNTDDNLRAAQRTITALYQCFENYRVRRVGTDSFDALFGGFLLLGDGRQEWWEVLGVTQDAAKREVTRAYRRKVQVSHPDKGGSEAAFKLVQDAYDQALATFGR